VRGQWPTGRLEDITEEWKRAVEAERVKREMTRKDLAKKINRAASSISYLLRPVTADPPGPAQSRIARAVSRVLGVPMPGDEDEDRHTELADRVAEKLRWAFLHDRKQYDSLEYLLRRMLEASVEENVKTMTVPIKPGTVLTEKGSDRQDGVGSDDTEASTRDRRRKRPPRIR